MMKTRLSLSILVLLYGCAEPKAKDVFVHEMYYPVIRQSPLDPVYSRVTWSHLPKPIGPRVASSAPYLKKEILFEMPNSTLQESIVALAHSMGYEALYTDSLAKRKVSLVTEGTHEEILDKICEQSKTTAEIDHKERIIRIFDDNLVPTLP